MIQVKGVSNEWSNALGARNNKRKSFSNQFIRFETLLQANCVIALHLLSSSSLLLLLYMIERNEERKQNEEKDETKKKDRYLYCN